MMFEEGTEVVFMLECFPPTPVPTQTGIQMHMNCMNGHYRGEDEDYHIIDVTSISPTAMGCRVPKAKTALIGAVGSVKVEKPKIIRPA
jgi:hypothetical protein